VRLPGLGASYTPPDLRCNSAFVPPRGASAAPIRMLVAQRAQKLTPRHDRLYTRIAAAVPEAEFCFAPDPDPAVCAELAARLERAFAAAGVDARGRLHVMPELAYADFLSLAQACDLHLDSVGFSGGITSMELLSLGIPTVTLPGLRMRSRQTAAMLRLLEVPELIAADDDGYVEIATGLARAPQRRLELRQRILAHRSRLHDGAAVEAAFARFLEEAWSGHTIPTH
jgi:predicted O-linked N-acetylglucosamine transferase (SPINDLY family)